MDEYDEFALALLDQLSVEINEEKEITAANKLATQTLSSLVQFEDLSTLSRSIFPKMADELEKFTEIQVNKETKLQVLNLVEFKKLKGKKVFAPSGTNEFVNNLFTSIALYQQDKIAEIMKRDMSKFLVYSTYAKSYISKISTTYGDYLDSTIYLNGFILESYPNIILHKKGLPYKSNFEKINSGYIGALKMTILEEQVHSIQNNLQEKNKNSVREVNSINEDLAKMIISLDNSTVTKLSDYLQIQPIPDEFPIARKANLFFVLNPDTFIVQVLGSDVMTFSKVEIDPKIAEMVPGLLKIYQKWLKPIQVHHAAFTAMEGMAEFAVQNILKNDQDFQNYLETFANSDITAYQVRKGIGRDFTEAVFDKIGKNAYQVIINNPPTTKELKSPEIYLKRYDKGF